MLSRVAEALYWMARYIERAEDLTRLIAVNFNALLDQAALDAVKRWKFTPTTVQDAAVPVIMTVTMNFTKQ